MMKDWNRLGQSRRLKANLQASRPPHDVLVEHKEIFFGGLYQ
jgi:hypothetical protein